jgi:hypothetical protein
MEEPDVKNDGFLLPRSKLRKGSAMMSSAGSNEASQYVRTEDEDLPGADHHIQEHEGEESAIEVINNGSGLK